MHPLGLLPSVRQFMCTVHMGYPKTNDVLKYYANNYLNMKVNYLSFSLWHTDIDHTNEIKQVDDFKRKYMKLRKDNINKKTQQDVIQIDEIPEIVQKRIVQLFEMMGKGVINSPFFVGFDWIFVSASIIYITIIIWIDWILRIDSVVIFYV